MDGGDGDNGGGGGLDGGSVTSAKYGEVVVKDGQEEIEGGKRWTPRMPIVRPRDKPKAKKRHRCILAIVFDKKCTHYYMYNKVYILITRKSAKH